MKLIHLTLNRLYLKKITKIQLFREGSKVHQKVKKKLLNLQILLIILRVLK